MSTVKNPVGPMSPFSGGETAVGFFAGAQNDKPEALLGCPLSLRHLLALAFAATGISVALAQRPDSSSAGIIDIGSRRELFVDEFLVDRLAGKAALRLHQPVPREIAIEHNAPWEGSGSGYHSIFKDGDRYRMYYKAWQINPLHEAKVKGADAGHPLFCCYAESDDGVHWRKPDLGLHEFKGSKANNIVMAGVTKEGVKFNAGHPAVFKDENPNAAPDARYKALFPGGKPKGLVPLKSHDGIHWSAMSTTPVITDGAFDSQNLGFWDGVRGVYRAYWRYFDQGTKATPYVGTRSIRTATSKDFLHWENEADLKYGDSLSEQLYTNQVKPYHRAPHLLVGFPIRYIDRGWSDSMRALPEREHREMRAAASRRYGTAITEGLFMVSRDGVNFKRWSEAFIRPGIEREGTWNYGHLGIAWHVVETKSALAGAPDELSLYAVESYWTGNSSALRRYTLRMDGFASVQAPMSGGELLTKPLRFHGSRLALNFATSAAGSIRVEIQDLAGVPVPGFALDECPQIFGDTIDRAISWGNRRDVSTLAGKPVRLRFELKDANVYAFRFFD
jgi:hypothetical protein